VYVKRLVPDGVDAAAAAGVDLSAAVYLTAEELPRGDALEGKDGCVSVY